MYHAQWGFRNNEFKAQRETPFVFLKLAFRPNTNFHMHHFHHQPKYSSAHSYYVQWTPQQRDILPVKTSFLCSLLERYHPITEPVFDDKINYCDPFCSLAFCFTITDIRHNLFFFSFLFPLVFMLEVKRSELRNYKNVFMQMKVNQHEHFNA